MSTTSLSSPSVGEAPPRPRFRLDDKYIAPAFITILLAVGQYSFGILESYSRTLTAIAVSILTELVLSRLFTGKWPHLASAYISGISVGILVRSPEIWPYALCSAISITSKYVIRWNGRHIWNPSNLGIVAMLIFAHDTVATLSVQWDNRIWAMIVVWVLGSTIIYRLKRFHICLTYVVFFFLFAWIRSLLIPGGNFLVEIAPITGPMYQLFIFFMITDPRTTVHSKKGQILVAFLVALAECLIRLHGSLTSQIYFAVHAPYYALFLMGPAANFIEIGQQIRKKRLAAKAALTMAPAGEGATEASMPSLTAAEKK
jgi:Na+-translocating ferredoxin:NAD+ oxidoreductase RnfD subunit